MGANSKEPPSCGDGCCPRAGYSWNMGVNIEDGTTDRNVYVYPFVVLLTVLTIQLLGYPILTHT